MHEISVLIVEDNPLAAKVAQGLFLKEKCLVDIAENGLNAIEKFETGQYQLVIMDIGLPDITGFEVTEKIRKYEASQQTPPVVIMGLTASTTEETLILGLKSGMNEVWAKPLTAEMLNKILAKFEVASGKTVKKSKKSAKINEFKNVIDLKLGAEILGGSEKQAKEVIKKLVDMLPGELEKIQEAFLKEDYSQLKFLVHYIKGGVSFCGTPLLTEAVTELDNVLKSHNPTMNGIELAYNHLCREIKSVISEYNTIFKKS